MDVSEERPEFLCEDTHVHVTVRKAAHYFRNAQSGRVRAVCDQCMARLRELQLSKIEEITEDEYVVSLVMDC